MKGMYLVQWDAVLSYLLGRMKKETINLMDALTWAL